MYKIKYYKSKFEKQLGRQLQVVKIPFDYEREKIAYTIPAQSCVYTPDFFLGNGIIIEAKGQFRRSDRQKHLLVRAQHPELDIRFVFQNARVRISRGSPTTYGDWCTKHGFLWADGVIPADWMIPQQRSGRA